MSMGDIGADSICQIGILVEDIETTGKAYADFFGVECPPVIFSGEYEKVKSVYNGEPCKATCKMMFFNIGQLQIELIQPDSTPSIWRDDLNKNGEGLHHIAFQVKNSEKKVKILEAKGFSLRQTGDYADNSGRYSYIDTRDSLKLIIELLESYNQK